MIKNNYHTHTVYCNHARGTVEDMIKAAIDAGFEEIGMSDHAPVIPNLGDYGEEALKLDGNMTFETAQKYIRECEECKVKYQDKIKVYTGFETEYLPKGIEFYKKLRSMVEYLNLGVHYFEKDGKVLNSYGDITYETLEYYVEACIEGMKTGLYNTLCHPDLFMIMYKNKNGERKFDEECVKATRRLCEATIKYNCYIEMNANGLRDWGAKADPSEWFYPNTDFWTIAKEYPELKIIIGADAHNPEALTCENLECVCKLADKLGLKILDKMVINH